MRLWPRGESRTLEPPEFQQPPYVYLPLANGTAVTPVTALMNVNAWSCIRVLSDAAASCPLIVYRKSDDGSRRRVPRGRTAELLERPAEDTVLADLISTLMLHLLLHGNAYIGKYKDTDGRVEQLLPIDPTQVQVERRAGRIRFTVTQDGRMQQVGLDDLIHVKALSNDGLVGLSPIRAMRLALEGDNAVQTASALLFKNGARPSGILSASRISADQAQQIKDQWSLKHSGDQAGGIAVLSAEDFTFTPISMPNDDAQFVEARKLSATEIARAFRVPPWMIGAESGDSMTYSNTESQMLSFSVLSLQPWLRSIEQALSADPDLFGPSSFAEFLIDGLLRADSRTRSEVYTAALDPITGWMRRDEVRRAENLPPETDAQAPAVPIPSEGAFA